MIPEDDRGLLLGDGLFETLLAEGGELRWWDRHMDRLRRGCAVLGLAPPDPGEARALAEGALRQAGAEEGPAAVRLTLTAGSGRGLDRPPGSEPRLLASAARSSPPAGPARLATSVVRRNEGSPASRLKSLAYLDNILARREAKAAGADEALLLNGRGELACAAAANLFWLKGRRLFTPALDCGVLDGIMRGRVIELAGALGLEAQEVRAPRSALDEAEGVFLTNSLIGVQPVIQLDGRALEIPEAVRALAGRARAPDSGA